MSDRVFAALGVMVGTLVMASGVRFWRRTTQRVKRAIRVRGRVVSFREEDDEGSRTWVPAVEFEVNGVVRSISGSGESSEPTIGKRVSVLYFADDPSVAWVEGSAGPWFLPLLTIVAGLAIAGGFLVWLVDG